MQASDLFYWPAPSSAGVPGPTGQRTFGIYALSILAAQASALTYLGPGIVPIDENGVEYFWGGSSYSAFGSAGVADGDKGDITVGSAGTVYTIDTGSVTLAKMANLAANSIIGNNTGGAATPIALTAAQVKTLLAIAVADISDMSANARSFNQAANFAAMRAAGSMAALTQTGEMMGMSLIGSVVNGTYTLLLEAKHGGTITETTTKSTSGTATATFTINGTNLGGTANAVSSTKQTQAQASANVFAAGDLIAVVVTGASSLTDLLITLKYTRTLV